MSIFEQATRNKLRFRATNGLVSVEDLWDLGLTHLDLIAKGLRKELRDEDDSFIDDKKKNTQLELKFEVVKHIITTRMEEKNTQVAQREKDARRKKILEVMEAKQDSSLQNMSMEDLKKELDAM